MTVHKSWKTPKYEAFTYIVDFDEGYIRTIFPENFISDQESLRNPNLVKTGAQTMVKPIYQDENTGKVYQCVGNDLAPFLPI